jgi:hypothetical protein
LIDDSVRSQLAQWPAIERQLVQLTQHLCEACAPGPLGVYLHGSLAMGCFNPERSDVDLLVVTEAPLAPPQIRALAGCMLRDSGRPRPVEISICHYAQLHPWRYPTPFDFHFSESWRTRVANMLENGDLGALAGAAPAGDPDLAAHCTVARRRGICLAGAPIVDVIPEVPWPDYLDAILRDVAWAADEANADPVYQTLNLCRVWAAVADGLVLSKAEGAEWAQMRLPEPLATPVAAVLAVYGGRRPETAISAEATAPVAAWIRQQLPA